MPSTKKRAIVKKAKYENRVILFLDFLGFKELVDQTVQQPDFLNKLISAMDIVRQIGQDNAAFLKSQRITQFSDSIVVSYDVGETSAVFSLLNNIAFAVIHLAEKGFLVRGGLTVGDLLHSSRHLVGPAMVEAYRLESKIAKVPRIVIDEKVIEVARQSNSNTNSPEDEEEYVRAFMTKDTDGRQYFNYISWRSVVEVTGGDNDLYGEYLYGIGTLLKSGLSHADPGVKEKYLWLHQQYIAAIDLVVSLPPNHGYRLENYELCEAIQSLSRYDDLAAEAARIVKALQVPKNPNIWQRLGLRKFFDGLFSLIPR